MCGHGDPGIEEWCKEILLRQYRGDQEAFDAILERLATRVAIMPLGDEESWESRVSVVEAGR